MSPSPVDYLDVSFDNDTASTPPRLVPEAMRKSRVSLFQMTKASLPVPENVHSPSSVFGPGQDDAPRLVSALT